MPMMNHNDTPGVYIGEYIIVRHSVHLWHRTITRVPTWQPDARTRASGTSGCHFHEHVRKPYELRLAEATESKDIG